MLRGYPQKSFRTRYGGKSRYLSLVLTHEQLRDVDLLVELKKFDGIALKISSSNKELTKSFYEAMIALDNIESLNLGKMDLKLLPSFS